MGGHLSEVGVSKPVIGLLGTVEKLYVLLLSLFYLICFEALFFCYKRSFPFEKRNSFKSCISLLLTSSAILNFFVFEFFRFCQNVDFIFHQFRVRKLAEMAPARGHLGGGHDEVLNWRGRPTCQGYAPSQRLQWMDR